MRKLLHSLLPIIDVLLVPFVAVAGWILKLVRMAGMHRLPINRQLLRKIGVFPIRSHYYEPLFQPEQLRYSLRRDRNLPGLDLNVEGQLALLEQFHFNEELNRIPKEQQGQLQFFYRNGAFNSGDAEFLYNLIRLKKPRQIIEIGSGYSTMMANQAVQQNKQEDEVYQCRHVCIEPYEMPWLEKLPVEVIRERVEVVKPKLFQGLQENDILFIDSSHMIRPQGDVLFEFLEILPILQPGVLVHVHDIFTPKDYLDPWVLEEVRLWNEQYLLEAFLSLNPHFRVVGALNYLHHQHYEALKAKSPALYPEREPGSFWIQRVK